MVPDYRLAKLKALHEERLKVLEESQPFEGVYCVYSMAWLSQREMAKKRDLARETNQPPVLLEAC